MLITCPHTHRHTCFSDTCVQVRFSTKSFGLEAAEVAAEALKAVAHSLTHADMSDIIAGRPVRQQQHTTARWPQHSALPQLSAHGCLATLVCLRAMGLLLFDRGPSPLVCCAVLCRILQEDEALQALRIISAALSTAQLKHLNLSDNALGEKGLRAAAAAFMPVSAPASKPSLSQRAQYSQSWLPCWWRRAVGGRHHVLTAVLLLPAATSMLQCASCLASLLLAQPSLCLCPCVSLRPACVCVPGPGVCVAAECGLLGARLQRPV